MKKTSTIVAITCVAAATAVAIAGGTCLYAKKAVDTLPIDTTVQTVATAESADTPESAEQFAGISVTLNDGKLSVADNAAFLLKSRAGGDSISVIVDTVPDGVEYSENHGYLTFVSDELGVIQIANTTPSDGADCGVVTLQDANGNDVLAIEHKLSDTASVVVTAREFDAEKIDAVREAVVKACDMAELSNGYMTLTIAGNVVNPSKTDNVVFTSNTVSFATDEDRVYIKPYLMATKGAGFPEPLDISDNMAVLCSDYKDEETGLVPYLYETDSGILEFVANGDMALVNAFDANVADADKDTEWGSIDFSNAEREHFDADDWSYATNPGDEPHVL